MIRFILLLILFCFNPLIWLIVLLLDSRCFKNDDDDDDDEIIWTR